MIIDVGALFRPDRGAWAATDRAIGDAIERHGGFVCVGYPDADTVDGLAATMLAFFELSEEAKRRVASRATWPAGPRIYRGYRSSLQPGAWAHNEMFDIGPDSPFPAPDAVGMEMFAETNVWPDPAPRDGWQTAMRTYYALMADLGTRVMFAAGRWAGFADVDLEERFRHGNSTLRLLNYPPKPDGLAVRDETVADRDPTLVLAASRHTDASGLSLLWQREPGLQAEAPDGTWRDVPMIPNAVSVHLGTVLERMTSGRVPATPHRVVDHGTPRQSIGFFVEPGLEVALGPISAGAAQPADLSATYGWHLQERFHSMAGFADLVPAPG